MADEDKEPEQSPGEAGMLPTGDIVTTLTSRVIRGILSDDTSHTWRDHWRRWWIGGVGGIFYTALKNYFSAGIGVYGLWTMDPSSANKGELMFGYVMGFVVSAFAGGFVAWLSAVKSRRLLFLFGFAGVPILLSLMPWLQSKTPERLGWFIEELQAVKPAYADNEQRCVGDTAFIRGFKAAFGVRDQYDKYAVIVASGNSFDDAQAKLKTIIAQNPGLKLRVGPRRCDNAYYPIFASDWLPVDDAKNALDKIRKSTGISDAYLSPGPPFQNYQ